MVSHYILWMGIRIAKLVFDMSINLKAVRYVTGPVEEAVYFIQKTWESVVDVIVTKVFAEKRKIQSAVLRLTLNIALGVCTLVWAEAALYLFFRAVVAPHWAASIVLAVNGISLFGANALFVLERRREDARQRNKRPRPQSPLTRYKKPFLVGTAFMVGLFFVRVLVK